MNIQELEYYGYSGLHEAPQNEAEIAEEDLWFLPGPWGRAGFSAASRAAFAAAAFGQSYLTIIRGVLIALFCLLVVTFVPPISMWLPERLHPGMQQIRRCKSCHRNNFEQPDPGRGPPGSDRSYPALAIGFLVSGQMLGPARKAYLIPGGTQMALDQHIGGLRCISRLFGHGR